jgi:hypothetical protein
MEFPASIMAERSFFNMRHKPPKIGMRIVNTEFPRFVIANRDGQFWTGKDWIPRLREALLYAHADALREDIERLKARSR